MTKDRLQLLPPETGACTGKPTDWWFPLRKRETLSADIAEAKEKAAVAKLICKSCAGISQCLEYSLHHEPLGIWGGMDETERAMIRRRRNIMPTVPQEFICQSPGVGVAEHDLRIRQGINQADLRTHEIQPHCLLFRTSQWCYRVKQWLGSPLSL